MTQTLTNDVAPPDPEDHLPLVRMLARRFTASWREQEDLYQQGCVGLMKAVSRFDVHRGVSFSTYAVPLILGEMHALMRLDAPVHVPRRDREAQARLRRAEELLCHRLGREPTVDELACLLRIPPAELALIAESPVTLPLDSPASSDGRPLSETVSDSTSDSWIDRLLLRDLLGRLPLRDRKLVALRFRYGLTQRDTALRLGMTQVQVSRSEMRIKQLLRLEWRQA